MIRALQPLEMQLAEPVVIGSPISENCRFPPPASLHTGSPRAAIAYPLQRLAP